MEALARLIVGMPMEGKKKSGLTTLFGINYVVGPLPTWPSNYLPTILASLRELSSGGFRLQPTGTLAPTPILPL